MVIHLVEGGLEVMSAYIEDAAAAAACVFETFGGVEGYTAYLRNEVKHLGSKKSRKMERELVQERVVKHQCIAMNKVQSFKLILVPDN